jgi:transcriptional regulator with PAS, ATPase and Fis domain
MASELFGHVKGAFTDAVSDRVGRFELADKGTIFLDEITEMSPRMQTQILRVIQEGTFERLGESVTRKTDLRVIAATNLNMQEAITNGQFREDLFYRLNVIPVKVPPLRKRKEDIPYFVSHFLTKFNLLYSKNIIDIDPDALDILMEYDWPGNVREFENAIEYAFIRTKLKNSIGKCALPPDIKNKMESGCKEFKPFFLKDISQHELIELLGNNKWNQTFVAKKLQINRTTLWRYLKKNNLSPKN